MKKYADLAVKKTLELLAIDSPTGYTKQAAAYVKDEFLKMGYETGFTNKGGVFVDLGGKGDGLLLEAHVDTLGGMVEEIKENGRLRITNLGGLNPNNTEAENVRVITRDKKVYEGTFQLLNASTHVNGEYSSTKRAFDKLEVVLDEDVDDKKAVKELGIDVGDIVCFEPRSRVTKSGYIKSRFLDDKLNVGVLLAFAKYLRDKKIKLERHVYCHITVYEEVGHGGSSNVPEDVSEALSLDMGCVGDGLECNEKQVSICVKDAGGPYSYEMIDKLVMAAKKEKADYALGVYPYYGSDVEATLKGGYDIRHGLIGSGIYASHGYERGHIEGVLNTLKVLKGFLEI